MTNQPDVSTPAALRALVTIYPPSLASTYTANWLANGDNEVAAAQRLVITLSGVVNASVLLADVMVSVAPTGGLRDAGNTCQNVNVTGLVARGSFGDASQPALLMEDGLIAMDYGKQEGLGVGDAIVMRFNQWVHPVAVSSKAEVDMLLVFHPPDWADDYMGEWIDRSTLLVTVTALSERRVMSRFRNDTAVGVLHVRVLKAGNLTSRDRTSTASDASGIVASGSWGSVVCDSSVDVYSFRTLVVSFQPPALYVPASYTIQVSSDMSFRDDSDVVVVTQAVTPVDTSTAITATGVAASSAATSGRLWFLVQNLDEGVPVFVRVAVQPPSRVASLSEGVVQPELVFAAVSGSRPDNCLCSTVAAGLSCTSLMASSQWAPIIPRRPHIGPYLMIVRTTLLFKLRDF